MKLDGKYFLTFMLFLSFLLPHHGYTQLEKNDLVKPYRLKCEKGLIKIHSYPYTPYSQKKGVGETYVYRKGKLLYSIPKYISNPVFTYNNGEILVEVNYNIMFNHPDANHDKTGKIANKSLEFDGNVVTIYKSGELHQSIHFSELKLDTHSLKYIRIITKLIGHTYVKILQMQGS